jgi:hypothetical protein
MKKCGKCGAIQNNKHFYCIDCNNRLGPPLTDEEEKMETSKIKETINDLSNKADYFYVSKTDKFIVILLVIFSLLHALLILFGANYYRENQLYWLGFISILLAIAIAIDLRFPRISWELYRFRYLFVFENIDDLEPSRFMLWSRRFFSKLFLIIVAVAFVIMLILSFRKVPTQAPNNEEYFKTYISLIQQRLRLCCSVS